MMNQRRYAVLGAGMAGLSCAVTLAQAGHRVLILDKGRRPGGRVATRRLEGATFNHGAQFASVQGPAFASLTADLVAAGTLAAWPAAGGRLVGVPGMSALPSALAGAAEHLGAHLVMARHAAFLHRAADGWHVRHMPAETMRPGAVSDIGGQHDGPFDAVLVTLPAPQAAALLATVPGCALAARAGEAKLSPCWAVMAIFDTPVTAKDVWRGEDAVVAWAAREGSRPGAPDGPERWMLHAAAGWSAAHLEHDAEDVTAEVLGAFQAMVGAPAPIYAAAHRWRHAQVAAPLGVACLWDQAGIGAAGDWCIGPRAEAAFDSGRALALAAMAGA
jgi:predicted NAD/FAD-dependent oxidoreductase